MRRFEGSSWLDADSKRLNDKSVEYNLRAFEHFHDNDWEAFNA